MSGWIDISILLAPETPVWPGDPPFRIEREDKGPFVLSTVAMTVHTGTHVDAPLHFLPNGAAIDALPPDALVGEARVIRIEDAGDVRRGERVLIKGSEVPPATARLFAERGVRCVGVEGLTVGDFETHRILLGAGVWCIENLDLSAAAPGRYELVCLPLRIAGAEGAPARALLRPL
jgi:arylformamidase